MTLRETWLATGATQGVIYDVLVDLFGANAIDKSTFERALRAAVSSEDRTKAQITRACAEYLRTVSRRTQRT